MLRINYNLSNLFSCGYGLYQYIIIEYIWPAFVNFKALYKNLKYYLRISFGKYNAWNLINKINKN